MPRRELRPGDVCRVNAKGARWKVGKIGALVVFTGEVAIRPSGDVDAFYAFVCPRSGTRTTGLVTEVDVLDEET